MANAPVGASELPALLGRVGLAEAVAEPRNPMGD
jgi:hypothetical protein